MGSRKYIKDYDVVTTVNEKGKEVKEAVYRGNYFELLTDEKKLADFKRNTMLLWILIVAVQFVGGFLVNNKGMNQMFVALPYAIAFFPLVYLGFGIFRLPIKKRKYKSDEIGLSFERVQKTSVVLLILLSMCTLGQIIFLVFIAKSGISTEALIFLFLEIFAAFATYGIIYLQKQIEYQQIDHN